MAGLPFFFTIPAPPSEPEGPILAMWMWTAENVITTPAEKQAFFAAAAAIELTDVFTFYTSPKYASLKSSIQSFNAEAASLGIRVHGMEGWRGYFSDNFGPADLYAAADELIAYNASVAPGERFSGFHSDMEPQDGQGDEVIFFHNGIGDSALTTQQRADREFLMNDWVTIHSVLADKMRTNGLKFGSAIPAWVDDYFGGPVHVNYATGALVMHALMPHIDEYVVMSYNTDTTNATGRVTGDAAYADTLAVGSRPVIMASIETHVGPGATVSYGDHATKNNRVAALQDLQTIASNLSVYESFGGMAIHDWVGWRDLAAS